MSRLSDGRGLLALSVLALPLFALPGTLSYLTLPIRTLVVIVAAIYASVVYGSTFYKTFQTLPRIVRVCLSLFVAVSILSSLNALRHYPHDALLGSDAGTIGLGLWISFIVIGLCVMPVIRQVVFSQTALIIVLAVGLLSLYTDRAAVHDGLRLGGLLYQSTSMAIYSCLAMVIAFVALGKQLEKKSYYLAWAVLLIHFIIIVLSQSRIGWLCLFVIIAVNAWQFTKQRTVIAVASCFLLVSLLTLPILFSSYFSRYQATSVSHGSTYRLELYETAVHDIARHNVIFGNGTDSLPAAINNRREVPDDIAKTLNQGYMFTSAHNMFIDIAYFFGASAAILLLIIIGHSLLNQHRNYRHTKQNMPYLLLFGVLCANALFNIPSIELTPLFFIILFGLLKSAAHDKTS